MTIDISCIGKLSDRDLLANVHRAVTQERRATADLIALLMELDARRLYLGEGCSSLFTYCTRVLHLSEHAAYGRIEAARAARRFPVILELLSEGAVTLTTIGLLAPHLTASNHMDVLNGTKHKSKREVEHLVACLRPRPDVPTAIRKLPPPRPLPAAGETADASALKSTPQPAARVFVPTSPSRATETQPLAPERFKIQFTVSRETHDQLRRAQDLLRHSIPNGQVELIFERALGLLIEQLSKSKCAAVSPSRKHAPAREKRREVGERKTRHIPAAVKRQVWERDGGRCAFKGDQARCAETGFLEFHHVVPFAEGGEATTNNIQLRCRAHNAYEAERAFGPHQFIVREESASFGVAATAIGVTRSGPSPDVQRCGMPVSCLQIW